MSEIDLVASLGDVLGVWRHADRRATKSHNFDGHPTYALAGLVG